MQTKNIFLAGWRATTRGKNMLATGGLAALLALAACGGGGGGGGATTAAVAAATSVTGSASAQLASMQGLGGRVLVGYQGWFGCPGDFEGNTSWIHWFDGQATPQKVTVEMLPDVSGFAPQDLCDTGLRRADGSAVRVFSSQNPNVVARHFEWMSDHGIDGAAVQRFVSETRIPALRSRSDNMLGHVRRNAERLGRVFYLTYDISGDQEDVADQIRRDWRALVEQSHITDSPAYLRAGGKPVIQLWGFGFRDRPGSAESARQLIADLRSGALGPAATVIGGVPSRWRTLGMDSRPEAAWADVYRSYDVISPWAVGRYGTQDGADAFARDVMADDRIEARRAGIGYLPVVFPGFSWHNLMATRGTTAPMNQTPRDCGNFLWRQVTNAAPDGALYAAMFDEVDEGTALFPVEPRASASPADVPMLSLGADGCDLASDWYLRVLGRAAQSLHTGTALPATLAEARP